MTENELLIKLGLNMKNWWQEITGYSVSICGWFFHLLPGTCEGWTKAFILVTVIVTFFGITLPKACDNIKKRWNKKD